MPDTPVLNGAPSATGLDRAADPAAVHRAGVNKANARKSTGPRTDAGKQRTRLNALRDGLTGQTVVLPAEDHSAYQCHSQSFLDEYQPKGATETQLVQFLIDAAWRLNRAAAVETNLFSLGITEWKDRIRANHPEAEDALAMAAAFREHMRAFSQVSINSQRLSRQFERTLFQLRHIQAERRKAEQEQLDNAAKILKMRKHENLPYEPAEDGFVFSNNEIETFLRRRERSKQANTFDFWGHSLTQETAS